MEKARVRIASAWRSTFEGLLGFRAFFCFFLWRALKVLGRFFAVLGSGPSGLLGFRAFFVNFFLLGALVRRVIRALGLWGFWVWGL